MNVMVPTTQIRLHQGKGGLRFEQMFIECQPSDPAVRRPASPIPNGKREWRGLNVVDGWDGKASSVYPAEEELDV